MSMSMLKTEGGQLGLSCRMHFGGPVTTMSSALVNFTCWTVWDTTVKFEFTFLVSVLVPVSSVAMSLDSLSEIIVWLAQRKF